MNARFSLAVRVSMAACGLLLAAAPAWSGSTSIYKCFDRNLTLLYTDQPCKDGEQLDLRPGDADPASLARLERERDRLDQSAAQRIADERHAALQRDLAYGPMRGDVFYDNSAPAPDYSLDYGYPLLAFPSRPRHRRPHLPPVAAPRFGPSPPFQVPRQ